MVVFCLYAISLCQYATGKSTTLPIEMKQIYYAFPVGSILVILFSVENIYRNFLGFLHNGELPLLKGGNKL
ncbi:hypothetical protein SDC9_210553 [bioreactor metagenome]|uniref:Uncharacterized protein n=1 Tax=bioreactor metagenome TaxID=1076179 RepID=A0A645JI67_9ZZZZ